MQIRAIQWDFEAWEDYLYWQGTGQKGAETNQSACKRHKPEPA